MLPLYTDSTGQFKDISDHQLIAQFKLACGFSLETSNKPDLTSGLTTDFFDQLNNVFSLKNMRESILLQTPHSLVY